MIKYILILSLITINFLYSISSIAKSINEYQKGLNFYRDKNYKKSKEQFQKSLEINSNITYPYIMLGNSFYYLGEYSNAINEYENYLQNPYDDNNIGYVYLYIAKCYRKLNFFNLSLTNLKKARKYSFYDETDYYFEALNYFNDKEKNNIKIDDKEFFKKIFDKSKQYTNSYYIQNNLGRCYLYKSENSKQIITNLDIAISYFKKAIILNKTNNYIYFKNYYHCFFKKGEFYKSKYEDNFKTEKHYMYYTNSLTNYTKSINIIQRSINFFPKNKNIITNMKIYQKNKNTLKAHYETYFLKK